MTRLYEDETSEANASCSNADLHVIYFVSTCFLRRTVDHQCRKTHAVDRKYRCSDAVHWMFKPRNTRDFNGALDTRKLCYQATNSWFSLILAHAQMPDDCERGHALDNWTRMRTNPSDVVQIRVYWQLGKMYFSGSLSQLCSCANAKHSHTLALNNRCACAITSFLTSQP